MAYFNCADNDYRITAGTGTLKYGRVIQNPDKFGGYNVSFSTGGLAVYHVHFFAGGTQVSVIRYKSGAGAEGENIVKCTKGEKNSFSNLAYECRNFPNHKALMENFKTALADVKRSVGNELT